MGALRRCTGAVLTSFIAGGKRITFPLLLADILMAVDARDVELQVLQEGCVTVAVCCRRL